MNNSKKDNRVCLNCSKSIRHKKSNAKFCEDTCRSEYFNKHNKSRTIKTKLKDIPSPVENSIVAKAPLKLGAIVGEQKQTFLPKNNNELFDLY